MKKSTAVVAVVGALVLAYGGASWYIGKQAQVRIEQAVAEANQKLITVLGPDLSGEDLKFSILEYQRGIFSSDVTSSLQLRDEDGNNIELLLHNDLKHGPFPFTAVADGNFGPMLGYSHSRLVPTEALKPWFDAAEGEPLEVHTSIGLNGAGVSEWRFAPVELSMNATNIQFSGAELNMNFESNWEEGRANGIFPLLDVQDDTGRLLIRNVELSSNATRNDDNVLQSESLVKVAQVSVSGSGLAAVDIDNLEVELNSEQQGNIIDGDLRYKFGSIKAIGMDLGSMDLRVSASKLDAQVLSELAVMVDQSGADDLEVTPEEMAGLSTALMALLKTNPSISIDPLSWKNAGGESRLVLKADLQDPQAAEPADQEGDLAYLDSATLDVTLSRDMFIRLFSQSQGGGESGLESFGGMLFDQYAARLQGAGLVGPDQSDIVLKASYTEGQVNLNGQSMSVEEFLQRVMLAAM